MHRCWSYSILINNGYVELFIDRGAEKKSETDQIYQMFLDDKKRIESDFGEPLYCDKKEGWQICRIKSFCNLGGLNMIKSGIKSKMI